MARVSPSWRMSNHRRECGTCSRDVDSTDLPSLFQDPGLRVETALRVEGDDIAKALPYLDTQMDVRPQLTDSPSIWDGAQQFTGVNLLSGFSVCAGIDAPRTRRSITCWNQHLPPQSR